MLESILKKALRFRRDRFDRWWSWPIAAAACLLSGAPFLLALAKGRLLQGYDATFYVLMLHEFHENAAHGNFFTTWAQNINFGYGSPYSLYRQPLYTYLSEMAFFFSQNFFAALNLSCLLLIAASSLGIALLARFLAKHILPGEPRNRTWFILTAICGYVLSPYLAYNFYIRGAYSESTTSAVLPFLALAFLRLVESPGWRRAALAATAYACLAIGHPVIHLVATPILALAFLLYCRDRKTLAFAAAAGLLGLMGSFFYWFPVLVEKDLTKAVLAAADTYSYSRHLFGLHQILWPSIGRNLEDFRYFPGFLFLFGLCGAAFILARKQDEGNAHPPAFRRAALFLLAIVCVCIYLMHCSSFFWWEQFPMMQMMQFPSRLLVIITFASCLLGALCAAFFFTRTWQWLALLALVFISGKADVARAKFSSWTPEIFTPQAVAQRGWFWEPHYDSPSTMPVFPSVAAARLVDVTQGAAQLDCRREAPTLISCKVFNAAPATLRLNVFDYPGWTAFVDAKPSSAMGRDSLHGAMLVTLDQPGEHAVRWEFGPTRARFFAKWISIAAWLGLLALMFMGRNFMPRPLEACFKFLSRLRSIPGAARRIGEACGKRVRSLAGGIRDYPVMGAVREHPAALVLTLNSALIAYWFLPNVLHASISSNDEILHISMVRQMQEIWSRGGDILDFWSAHLVLGNSIIRMSHWLFYFFAWLVHQAAPAGASIEQSFYFSMLLCAMMIPWSFYCGAKWLGFSKSESLMTALLYTLTFDSAGYGVGLNNYTSWGHGIDNQGFALLFFPLCMGLAHRALRGEGSVISAGLAFAATFMSHLFQGYMAELWITLDAVLVCAARPKEWRRITGAWLGLHVWFCLFAATSLYPHLRDHLLQHKSLEEAAYKFLGVGARSILGDFVSGRFLDADLTFAPITVFSVIGFILGMAAFIRQPRALDRFHSSALPIHALFWLALSFGPGTWPILYWLPFSKELHWHRFIVAAQMALLFCAGAGLAGAFDFCRFWIRGKFKVFLIGACLAALFLPALKYRHQHFTVTQAQRAIQVQELWKKDRAFHEILGFALAHPEGRYYAGNFRNFGRDISIFDIQLFDVLTQYDVDTVSYLFTSFNHTSTLYYRTDLRDPQDPRQEELFGIRYVILPNKMPPQPRYKTLLRTDVATLYDSGQREGYFMVGTMGPKGCADSDGLSHSIPPWLQGPLADNRIFPLVELSGDCTGQALLTDAVQQPYPPQARGAILETGVNPGIHSRHYWAKVRMDTQGLLVFKMNYHPAWRAFVNGSERTTMMVIPAYQAVSLDPGVWDVRLEYRPPKTRRMLFIGTLFLIVLAPVSRLLYNRFSAKRR